ncbi:senecionine N-oxygenase-like [Pararge aegeria]|uniref:senecionine N-oxygenase-like n=1 Tax=Pararge aegeria TaxID=116150 RepID=UPI0019D11810|nr:senecionine N-oxygenase-like [Pararge aegeria]
MTKIPNPRVCIIGAGLAGLISARYLQDEGISFTVLEGTQYVGGTWRYDPRVGTDEYGQPLQTSMYKNLRTNLPKPTMELRGFPLPEDAPSFMKRETVYKYIEDYVKHFDLEKRIKFLHKVILVSREENIWKVKHQNVATGEEFEDEYDYVFVATGHFNKPNYPDIAGEKLFTGTIIHSHDYRERDNFKDRRVLIVGAGPSGLDIAIDVAYVSKTLVHSHHSKAPLKTVFPEHYIKKPDIKEFNTTGVIFEDGSYEDTDDVIYCTGYQYYLPFLDISCGLEWDRQCVKPLHKYMVNIHQPTMLFLGAIVRACLVVALDAQARYAAVLVKGDFTLPSKENMLEEWNRKVETIRTNGRPLSDLHVIADAEDSYYAALTDESGIERVPPHMMKIHKLLLRTMFDNLYTFRDYVYTILDDENVKVSIENETENTRTV